MSNLRIVILAAGQGKRMGGDLPKVLIPLKGRPMLSYLLKSVAESGVDASPVVVIGKGADQVKEAFGSVCTYVLQEQRLGTGHAVKTAQPVLSTATDVMVLYGDHPLISPELIKGLATSHLNSQEVFTMATFVAPDFKDWRSEFQYFSRLIRDSAGKVVQDVQIQDATPEQLSVKELNPCYFCFKADWLWENLAKLETNNAQQEYYLTDLIKMAIAQGHTINTVQIKNITEALGINTPQQFEAIEKLL